MGFFDSNSRTSNDAAQVGQSGEGDLPVNINLSNLRLHKSPNSDIITNVTLSDFGDIDGAFDFAGNAFDEATALVDDTLQAGIEASRDASRVADQAIQSNEVIAAEAIDASVDVNRDSLDFAETVVDDSLAFASDVQRDVNVTLENVTGDALDFAEGVQADALDTVDDALALVDQAGADAADLAEQSVNLAEYALDLGGDAQRNAFSFAETSLSYAAEVAGISEDSIEQSIRLAENVNRDSLEFASDLTRDNNEYIAGITQIAVDEVSDANLAALDFADGTLDETFDFALQTNLLLDSSLGEDAERNRQFASDLAFDLTAQGFDAVAQSQADALEFGGFALGEVTDIVGEVVTDISELSAAAITDANLLALNNIEQFRGFSGSTVEAIRQASQSESAANNEQLFNFARVAVVAVSLAAAASFIFRKR